MIMFWPYVLLTIGLAPVLGAALICLVSILIEKWYSSSGDSWQPRRDNTPETRARYLGDVPVAPPTRS